MKKFNKKALNVMTTAALVASIAAPIAVSANSDNLVEKVASVADDFDSSTSAVTSIIIKEKDIDFKDNDTFRLTLPSGVKWKTDSVNGNFYTAGEFIKDDGTIVPAGSQGTDPRFEIVSVTDQDLELKIVGFDAALSAGKEQVKVPMLFEVDGATGELKVTVDPKNSTLSAGQYTFAIAAGGKTVSSVGEVKTIGDGGAIDTIRIDESTIGALYDSNDGDQEVTIKLPSKFKWMANSDNDNVTITLGGGYTAGQVSITDKAAGNTLGFSGNKVTIASADLNKVLDGDRTLKFNLKFTGKPAAPGTVYISGLAIDAESNAPYGDVEASIDGDKVNSQDLVVAKYADYGADLVVKKDIPTLLAGRANDKSDDLKLVEVEVKENVTASWFEGRSVKIEFPGSTKVVGVDVTEEKGFSNGDLETALVAAIDGDDNEVEFNVPTGNGSKKSFKAKFYVSSEADFEGDVVAKFSGRAGVEGEVTLGKVVSPVTVEVEKANVRTGIKEQELKDIVITEAEKGAFIDGKQVRIWLGDGDFTSKPKVEVVEGNLEIKDESVKVKDGVLTFDIKSESTRASKIKISGLKLDLYRSVPEGDISVKIGGEALVRNAHQDYSDNDIVAFSSNKGYNKFGDKSYTVPSTGVTTNDFDLSGSVDVGEFDKNYVKKATVATVITPADGAKTAEATFTLGSTTYTVDGVEKTADVAAYAENGRTYLPVRYVADALGVEESNILYDKATSTVTLIKDGLVAQMTIGSNILKINGANIPMDAKAQLKDNRTVLPLRYAAQALGANISFDEATKVITIKK
ncbi:copper amine oxidase N-terminal domain-containing protein [Ammoniphilus resinae]|uniref:Copper amine oxidase-like N-terminal domain-containing protein n=1 Tax=Ammoniphilus resinae TaxID=861532 RepID=A0ABS4GWW2_9BACL|nr:copper amine oxidase N-terminal domain-containing protein [Ammoniphilus resinae]MBP1934757.1 hypothetical protein [Ammoniphilus resinae]